jgi:hypothetical protein
VREAETEAAAPQPAAQEAQLRAPAGGHESLLQLQQAIGNRAMAQLVAGRRALARTPNEDRFRAIFAEENAQRPGTAHVQTLIRAFTDPGITDQGSTPIERAMSVLVLTGGTRPVNSDYLGTPSPHFNATLVGIGTGRPGVPNATGDLGFRREFRDSLVGHRGSSNQIGHFLTAVDIGIQADIRQGYVEADERFTREHPYLAAISRAMARGQSSSTYWAIERDAFLRAAVGHELVPDDAPGSLGGTVSAVRAASSADVENFLSGHLDRIRINPQQAGNSYQDLALTWTGYRFGVKLRRGAFASNAEAARWLTIMLTPYDLSTVSASDPFYADAQELAVILGQVRAMSPVAAPP